MTTPATAEAPPGGGRCAARGGQRDFWRQFAAPSRRGVRPRDPGLLHDPGHRPAALRRAARDRHHRVRPAFEPPIGGHILGTDELGRDILNLTVHGARVSMVIGLLATVITVLLGASSASRRASSADGPTPS